MTAQRLPAIDLAAYPELTPTLAEVEQSGRPLALQRDGETVALIIPIRSKRAKKQSTPTDAGIQALAPAMTIAELVATRPPWTGPTFTDEQIREALLEDRADNWLRKSEQIAPD